MSAGQAKSSANFPHWQKTMLHQPGILMAPLHYKWGQQQCTMPKLPLQWGDVLPKPQLHTFPTNGYGSEPVHKSVCQVSPMSSQPSSLSTTATHSLSFLPVFLISHYRFPSGCSCAAHPLLLPGCLTLCLPKPKPYPASSRGSSAFPLQVTMVE